MPFVAILGAGPLGGALAYALANRARFGEVRLVEQGGRAMGYSEAAGSAVMAREDIVIRIALGRGGAMATVRTSDLSHDYVSINADYRS